MAAAGCSECRDHDREHQPVGQSYTYKAQGAAGQLVGDDGASTNEEECERAYEFGQSCAPVHFKPPI